MLAMQLIKTKVQDEGKLNQCRSHNTFTFTPSYTPSMVRIGAVEVVVRRLAGEVDAEGDECDAEAGSGVAEVVDHHWVLPPLIPPPEELPRRSQRLRHHSPLISALTARQTLTSASPSAETLIPLPESAIRDCHRAGVAVAVAAHKALAGRRLWKIMYGSRSMFGSGGLLDGFEGRKREWMEPNPYFSVTSGSYDDPTKRQRLLESNPYFTVTAERFDDAPKRLPMLDSGNPYRRMSGPSNLYQSNSHDSVIGGSQLFPGVRLRGLPFACEESDVRDFFTGLSIVDVLLVKKDGRFLGDAYVIFSTPIQAELAIQRDRQMMGHRYIEVFECSKEDYYFAVSAEVNFWETSGNEHRGQSVPLRHGNKIRGDKDEEGMRFTFLRLRGLPYSVTEAEIVDFFRGFNLKEGKVHVVHRRDGKATGEAFVEFPSPEAAKKAMRMDKKMIGSRYVELFPATREEAGM